MKRNLYLLLLMFLAMNVQGQPTIRQADLPLAGDRWIDYGDSRSGAHNIPAFGPNQNWDYSKSFVVSDTSETSFVTPSGVPGFLQPGSFPKSNLATFSLADSMATYFVSNATGLFIDGAFQATGLGRIDIEPDQLFIPVPFTYNDARSGKDRWVALGMSDSLHIKIIFNETVSFTAPGYGNLTTPAGKFTNTLLVKRRSEYVDSFLVDFLGNGTYFLFNTGKDTTNDFYWVKSGRPRLTLMSLSADAQGTTSSSAAYSGLSVTSAEDPSRANSSLQLYPNPASSGRVIHILLEAADAYELSIMDTDGRNIRKDRIDGFDKVMLSTQGMSPGFYHYQVTDRQGAVLHSGKFVIQ